MNHKNSVLNVFDIGLLLVNVIQYVICKAYFTRYCYLFIHLHIYLFVCCCLLCLFIYITLFYFIYLKLFFKIKIINKITNCILVLTI